MTGYTTDKVSPSGQLEPPSPKDFPNFGSNIIRLKPPTEPMLPFVMLPRPLQEIERRRQGRHRRLPRARRTIRTRCIPTATTWTWTRWTGSRSTTCKLRPEVFAVRLERRAKLRDAINDGMPEIEKAVAKYNLDEYYDQALSLVALRPGPRGVRPRRREADDSATATAATRSARAACWPAGWSRPARASSRSSGRRSPTPTTTRGTHHVGLTERMKNQSGPMLDAGLSAPDRRPGRARPARRDAGGRRRRVRPQPAAGRQHLRQRQQRRRPRPLAVLLHRRHRRRRHQARLRPRQVATRPARAPLENPVHPSELLATIYHAFGIDPETIVYNHLNQPRELVKAEAVTRLFS